ncbi:MAG: DUF6452 family protein [Ferruginibacter sp.]
MKQIIFLTFLSLAGFTACKDAYNICDTPRDVALNAALYHRSSGGETAATASSLTLYLLNTTEYIYNQKPGLQKFSFDLIPVTDTAKYFLALQVGIPADTVTLIYSSRREMLPEPCGSVFTKTLYNVLFTRHTLDSIAIINPDVNTAGANNLKIYF